MSGARGDPASILPARGRWPLYGRDHELDRLVALCSTCLDGDIAHSARSDGPRADLPAADRTADSTTGSTTDRTADSAAAVGSAAGAPRSAGVCLIGPAGVGRSRLIQETARHLGERGETVHAVVADRNLRHRPYGALAHLLTSDGATLGSSVGGRPPILIVDDAHVLDEDSALLISRLARSNAVTLLVSARQSGPLPGGLDRLWMDGIITRIDLAPLRPDAVRALVEEVIGRVGRTAWEEIDRLTGGDLHLTEELVRTLIEQDAMALRGGLWNWDGSLPAPVIESDALNAVVESWVSECGDVARVALGYLGLAADLDHAQLVTLLGMRGHRDVDETGIVVRTVDELERAGLIVLDHGHDWVPRVRATAPLCGQLILARLPWGERSAMLRGLIALPRSGVPVRRIVQWRLELGERIDADTLGDVARQANDAFEPALAERFATEAIVAASAGSGSETVGSGHSAVALAATVEAARALSRRSEFDRAAALLASVDEEIRATGDVELIVSYVGQCFIAVYMGLGDAAALHDLLMSAGFDPAAVPWSVRGYLALPELDSGRIAEALALTGPVLEAIRCEADDLEFGAPFRPGDELNVLVCLEVAAEALAYRGEMGRARELHVPMLAMGRSGSPVVARATSSALFQEAMCLDLDGHHAEALAHLERTRSVVGDDPQVHALGRFIAGTQHLRCGRPASALHELRESAAGFRGADAGGSVSWVLVQISLAQAMLGDGRAARSTWAEAQAETRDRIPARMIADFALARAWLQCLDGDLTGAVAHLVEAASETGELCLHRARLLHRAGVWGSRVEEASPAVAEAVATGYGPARLWRRHLDAVAAADADALSLIADDYAGRGLVLWAVETASAASALHREAGQGRASDQDAARFRAWLDRCEGAVLPEVLDRNAGGVAPSAATLSNREHEVVRLAAAGRTNTEIAEALALSRRTVESHLYRAYGKLGVRNRSELADRLRAGRP